MTIGSSNKNGGAIEIPIKNTTQVIEVPLNELPESPDQICEILETEQTSLDLYLRFAKEYYSSNNITAYKFLLERGIQRKERSNTDLKGYISLLDHLASFYINQSLWERDKKKGAILIEEATTKVNEADRLDSHDELTLLVKGLLLMTKKNFDSAAYHFNAVLEKNPVNMCALLGNASICFCKKEFRDALLLYRRILFSYPKCLPFIRFGIGICQYQLGNLLEAKSAFLRTIQLDPRSVDALLYLAYVEMRTNPHSMVHDDGSNAYSSDNINAVDLQIRRSMEYLKRAYEIDNKNPIVCVELASHYFYKGDYPKCHALAFDSYSNSNSDELKARSCFLLGRVYHANENFDEAFRYYLQATKLDPEYTIALFSIGQCCLYRGEISDAISSFECVLMKQPNHYEALKIICSILNNFPKENKKFSKYIERLVCEFPDDLEGLLIYAGYLESVDVGESLKYYSRFVDSLRRQNVPVPVDILNNMAVINQKLGNLEAAHLIYQNIFDSLIDSAAKFPQEPFFQMKFNQALLMESLNRHEEAKEQYKNILKENPSSISCLLRLAAIEMAVQNYEASNEYLREAMTVDEGSKDVWTLTAHLHLSTKSITLCRKAYEQILTKIDRHDVYSLIALGNIYFDNSSKAPDKRQIEIELKKALEFYQKALLLDSHNYYAANGIGICLEARGYLNEAKDLFLQLKQNENDFSYGWINLAHICLETGHILAALNLYENCNRKFHDSKDPIILMFMAKCYYVLGKEEKNFEFLDRAIGCLETAIELKSRDDLIWYNLAMCQEEFAAVRLKAEDSKVTAEDIKQALQELDSAIKIYNSLLQWKEKDKKLIYDIDVVKQRLAHSLSLRESAAKQFERQARDDLIKKEKIEQLKEIRKEQQQAEQQRLFEQQQRKQQEEQAIEQQRKFIQEKLKLVPGKSREFALNNANVDTNPAASYSKSSTRQSDDIDEFKHPIDVSTNKTGVPIGRFSNTIFDDHTTESQQQSPNKSTREENATLSISDSIVAHDKKVEVDENEQENELFDTLFEE